MVLLALGIQKYFLDTFRILDAFVSMGSLGEIIVKIITYTTDISGGSGTGRFIVSNNV